MEVVAEKPTKKAIPEGYKRTKIGVIPKDWELLSLEDLTVANGLIRGPFGGALKKEYFVNHGYKVYQQKNAIYRDCKLGNYFIDQDKFRELRRFEVYADDFIVSCSGTIGEIYKIPEKSPKGIINQALLIIRIDERQADKEYFYQYFGWDEFQERITDSTQGGAMKNLIGMDEFRSTLISLPPTLEEQQAIAESLSDVDTLIAELDALIQKKQQVKKGAKQLLLTGKKRLPGFDGEWEEKKLGDVAAFSKGKGLPKKEIVADGKNKCIHYGELFTHYDENINEIKSRTNKNSNTFLSRGNDVLMPTSDVTPNGLATASCVKEDDVVLGGDILVIRVPKDSINGVFLSYRITQDKEQVMQFVSGTTVYHLYASGMSNFSFSVPSIEEQKAIVKILNDMDVEIQALQSKRAKYEKIKQGMMQELLTGKTRLV